MNVRFGSQAEVGVTSGTMQANQTKVHAAIGFAVTAGIAMPATHHRLDHHEIAWFDARHRGAGLGYGPANFMTANERVCRVGIASAVMLHVPRANSRGHGPEDDVARAALGRWPIAQAHLLRGIQDERFHAVTSVS